jgi:hypothetical protein
MYRVSSFDRDLITHNKSLNSEPFVISINPSVFTLLGASVLLLCFMSFPLVG